MTTRIQDKNGTGQQTTGLALSGHAWTADLLGKDTHKVSETPEIVQERYLLSLDLKRIERRMGEIDACLKVRTGERQVGNFWVKVSSFTVERLDSDMVKEIMGDAAPMKASVSVRLSVVPA